MTVESMKLKSKKRKTINERGRQRVSVRSTFVFFSMRGRAHRQGNQYSCECIEVIERKTRELRIHRNYDWWWLGAVRLDR